MLPLGFASGLPLALTAGTLQAWLTVAGLDLRTIGIFSLAGLPYTLKFLWSPVIDRFAPPWLGRRRGWMLGSQVALILGIAAMAVSGPESGTDPRIMLLGGLAIAVSFCDCPRPSRSVLDVFVHSWLARTFVPSTSEHPIVSSDGARGSVEAALAAARRAA